MYIYILYSGYFGPYIYIYICQPPWLRIYPLGFGVGLKDSMESWTARPTLRQKKEIDPRMTDVQIFESLPLGDLWHDAQLVECYRYLRGNKKIEVPPTWERVFQALDEELAKACSP